MIKYTRFLITLLLAVSSFAAFAQSTATTSSPYSRYGLGDIDPQGSTQSLGMGGIGVATNRIGVSSNANSVNPFNNINIINPASYGAISFTTIDIGVYSNFLTLSQTGSAGQKNSNFRLSHVAFAIPTSKHSAFSFGLLPYSERGYNYKNTVKGNGAIPADTNLTNYAYSGDGGLSKAYLGYGIGIGKHILIGANVSYIFGTLKDISTTEINTNINGVIYPLPGTTNSKIESSNSIAGLNYDYGVQYTVDFSDTKHLTLGYSGSLNSKLNSTSSFIVSQYFNDNSGNEDIPLDSVVNKQSAKTKIKLPLTNRFGISFQNDGKFLIGADYTMSKWSQFSIGGESQGLQDSRTFNIGGQYTPNIATLRNYLASVDYRLGAIYDETYMMVNNTRIKRYAVTAGIGMPLRPNNGSFYKINIGAEVGRRGSLVNGLVRENYVNIHLGFTLNDRWFQKYKFD